MFRVRVPLLASWSGVVFAQLAQQYLEGSRGEFVAFDRGAVTEHDQKDVRRAVLDGHPERRHLAVRFHGNVDESSFDGGTGATVLEFAQGGVAQEVHEGAKVLLAVLEVALPPGQEVSDASAENSAHEDTLERFLAVEDVVEQTGHDLVVVQVPIEAEFGRHVENVVELAQEAHVSVLHHCYVVIAEGGHHYPLADVLLV